MSNHTTCRIGSCQRHQKCMYTPCRNEPRVFTISARQQGKTLAGARDRVRRVAEGATINGTYRLPVGESLEAFRTDLLFLLKAIP